jgi:hypothetical protein
MPRNYLLPESRPPLAGIHSAEPGPIGSLNVLDILRSAVFVACELFVLFLAFSPFLLTTDETGARRFRPLGPGWILFGLACFAFVLTALFAPV